MGTESVQDLLAALDAAPDDGELRRRAAEALDDAGRTPDLARVLAPLVNLTGHDDDSGLPCLCKRCLAGAPATAEAAGMKFVRSIAVAGTRVLHFWMLADQERERAAVRASVQQALAARLAAQKAKR